MACLGLVSSLPTSGLQKRNPPTNVVKTDAAVRFLLPDVTQSVTLYQISQQRSISKILPQNSISACYEELGCFSRDGNFSSFGKLPLSPTILRTEFHLFTTGDQIQPEILNYSQPLSISISKFRSGEPIIVIIHGFGESAKAPWIQSFQTSIFRKVKSKIILKNLLSS